MLDNFDESTPATGELSARRWILDMAEQGIDLSGITVVADPDFSMVAGGGSFGTPMLTVVNPRDMSVYHNHQGYKGPDQMNEVEQLAEQNKLPE
jgi:hypothetical protein